MLVREQKYIRDLKSQQQVIYRFVPATQFTDGDYDTSFANTDQTITISSSNQRGEVLIKLGANDDGVITPPHSGVWLITAHATVENKTSNSVDADNVQAKLQATATLLLQHTGSNQRFFDTKYLEYSSAGTDRAPQLADAASQLAWVQVQGRLRICGTITPSLSNDPFNLKLRYDCQGNAGTLEVKSVFVGLTEQ